VSGPVTINTGLSGANPYVDATGVGRIERQAQVLATDNAALDTLRGMFERPSDFYVNMHSTEYPGWLYTCAVAARFCGSPDGHYAVSE